MMRRFSTLFFLFALLVLFAIQGINQPLLTAAQPEAVPVVQPNPVTSQAEVAEALGGENVELISQIGGSTEAVAAVGDYAYVGIGPRLVIFDISNSTYPQFVGQTNVLPNTILDVAVANNYAYVATTGSGLRIINISDRTAPYEEGAFDSGYTAAVTVANNVAYLVNSLGLRMINVANPQAPTEMAMLDISAASDVAVAGNHAYVTVADWSNNSGGLHIINISTPTPYEVAALDIGKAFAVAVANNIAYLITESNLRLIDVASPTTASEIGAIDISFASDVTVVGDYAYVADSSSLRIINVSTPAAPSEMDNYNYQGSGKRVAIADDMALVASSYGGLQLINVADPANASRVSVFETWMAADVAVTGNYADVADGWNGGLLAIHVGDPAAPDEVGSSKTEKETWRDWRRMTIASRYAYLAGGDLSIIDINSQFAPSLVETLDTPGDAYGGGVAVVNQIAYLADGEEGLRLINISEPEAPIEVGVFDTPGQALDVAVYDNYAYVADGEDGGLRIIDVSQPSAPSEVGFYNTLGDASGVAVAGDYAYVAEGDAGVLRIIDISQPEAPFQQGAIYISGRALDVTVVDNLAYVANHYEGLHIIDVTEPIAPIEVGYFDTPGYALNVTVANGYVYVADRHAGLLVLRYTGDTPTPTPTATPATTCPEQYYAEYYDNQTLSGSPAFVQCEDWPINHDWGINGPGNGLPSEGFSARWTGSATIQEGDYTFIYRADDGMRVWLNDELIIDDWDNPSLIEGRVTRYVSGGEYEIRVEYYENSGGAVAQFGWEEATIDSLAPSGNIIDPPDDMTTGVGTVRFSASAWDNQGGSGVNRVDFEISYDNGSGRGWRTVGTSYAEPYYIDWQTPSGLYSQILNFRIRVTDNAGNVTENPGGSRSVIFYESQNNPNLTENWVPESDRAYLNQLSLPPNGDNKCGAASAAMVLAMNNLIGSDYQSMAAKANEIYIYNNPLPSLVNSLRTNGTIADFYYRSMDDAWTLIKDEVNNGRPVIILTERFSFGHYFVAVGYREEGGNRYLIAYDPLGQWQGSYGSYDYNFPQPDSYKGKWVQYNYNDAWGYQEPSNPIAGYGYLITARPQNQVANREVLGDIPDSPPDMVSDEPENLGIYEGIEVDTTDFSHKIHLPLVIR